MKNIEGKQGERLRMKPSQRIEQIFQEMIKGDTGAFKGLLYPQAIIRYLDEEYEIACNEATHDFNMKHLGGDSL